MQSPCLLAINGINLLLNICSVIRELRRKRALSATRRRSLISLSFSTSRRSSSSRSLPAALEKCGVLSDLMLRSTGFQFVFFALLPSSLALVPCEFDCGVNDAQDCMEFLTLHSLSSLFDSIVTMDDAPLKPSPEPIHLAMRLAGGSRGIMFGDTKVRDAFDDRDADGRLCCHKSRPKKGFIPHA